MSGARRWDVLVMGATGATGREVARHLAHRAGEAGVRWAVTGRDRARLEALVDGLGVSGPHRPDLVIADLGDPPAVAALVAGTAVVANVAGPYATLGSPVYEACASLGTHQVDVCGEIDWLAAHAGAWHERARSSGACLVHTAGFEALPFDLAALLAAEAAASAWGRPLAGVDVAVTVERDPPILTVGDLLSGGTVASGAAALRRGWSSALSDCHVLDPEPHEPVPYDLAPRRHAGTGAWLGPVAPSPYINPPVAHRTAALLRAEGRELFGPGYRFQEGLVAAGLAPGLAPELGAHSLAAGQRAAALLAAAPPRWRDQVAAWAEALGPRPGHGPDEDHLGGWTWRLDARGVTAGGEVVDIVVEGEGHPGYRSTGRLVAEAALLLATDGADRHGLLTPAVAFGAGAADRFRPAGVTFHRPFPA